MAPKKNKRNEPKKKEKGQLPPNSQLYPIASDSTAVRLRGCTTVTTEVPRMMQTSANNSSLAFKATFLSSHHLYAFFKKTPESTLQLARLCLFSQTWQEVPSFSLPFHDLNYLRLLPLPWVANSRQVLLFYPNHCTLLTLKPPSTVAGPPETTLSEIDLHSMLSLPEGDNAVNVVLNVQARWCLVAADATNQTVYALVNVGLCPHRVDDLALFRLDWRSRLWTRLTLDLAEPGRPFVAFMTLHEDYLYIGGGNLAHFSREALLVNEVQRIDLTTLVLDRYPITGGPDLPILKQQLNMLFYPIGNIVYAMNALFDNQGAIVKNQLWALSLPSLVMTQINDGPQGELPQPLMPQLMSHFSLAATADGSELWALSTEAHSSQPPRLCMYRTLLKELPSLASMTLDCLLLRRPMAALLTPIECARTCSLCRIPKQMRTLPYLRSFVASIADLAPFAERLLPEDENWEEEMQPQQLQQQLNLPVINLSSAEDEPSELENF